MSEERNIIELDRGLLRWISLGIGLIALVTAAVAFVVTPQGTPEPLVVWIALGVGVAGLAGFVLLDPQSLAEALTGRSGQSRLTSIAISVVFVAFIVALYIIIREADIQPWDVSEQQKYQLSQESIDILENLGEPVRAYAFFVDGSPLKEEADLWLAQYERASNGQLTYEFVDPERNPSLASQYDVTRSGVVVFVQADRNSQSGDLSENGLTSALARALQGKAAVMYATTGHGERAIDDFQDTGYATIINTLNRANFTVNPVNLLQEGKVPDDADVLLIAGPTAQFAQSEVDSIAEYLNQGGALFLLSDPGTGGGSLGLGVLGIDYSPDGTRIATAGADGTARVWDAQTGEELVVLRGHASDVMDVTFSPDGDRLVTAGRDGTVRVWDASSGDEIATLEGQTDLVSRVAFSPDGSLIASAGEDQVLNVWDASTLQPMSYSPLTASVPLRALAFSPDSSLIAAAGGRQNASGPVLVWEAASGTSVVDKSVHTNSVFSIAFSPDGETIHSVAVDGTEGTLNIATGTANTTPLYPDLGMTSIAVNADGLYAFALTDGSIHLHEAGADTDSDTVIQAHSDVIWDIAFSPDGTQIASASRDGGISISDVASGEVDLSLTGHRASDPLLSYLEDNWAVRLQDDLVVDLLTSSEFDEFTPVVFNIEPSSPITQSLASSGRWVFLPIARSIEAVPLQNSPINQQPLLLSSTSNQGISSWGETSNPFAGGTIEFDDADIPGPLALAASVTNSDTGARMVIVGDADFASNQWLQRTAYGNQEFFVNAANWLAAGDNALALPPPNFELRTIQPFTTVGLGLVSISLTCLIPGVLLVIGLVVFVTRRRRR